MVNRRLKGRRAELKAVEELKKDGWLVHLVKGSTRWNKECDIYGIWDILAIKRLLEYRQPENIYVYVQKRLWIQVKTNRKPSAKEYINFKRDYCDDNDSCQLWVWFDRVGFKIFILSVGGNQSPSTTTAKI